MGCSTHGKAQGASEGQFRPQPLPTPPGLGERGARAERPQCHWQSQGVTLPGPCPPPSLGSPLPAAAWWPCLLPTGRSHSTLPSPSAEVGLGLRARSPASSHPHSTALLLLPVGTGMHSILWPYVASCRPPAPCLRAGGPFLCLASYIFGTLTVMSGITQP